MTRRRMMYAVAGLLAAARGIAAAKREPMTVLDYRCVGCRECAMVCPTGAAHIVRGKAVVDREKCIGCRLCRNVCSYGAIQ